MHACTLILRIESKITSIISYEPHLAGNHFLHFSLTFKDDAPICQLQLYSIKICGIWEAKARTTTNRVRLVMNSVPHHYVLLTSRHRSAHHERVLPLEGLNHKCQHFPPFFAVRQKGLSSCASVGHTIGLLPIWKGVVDEPGPLVLKAIAGHLAHRHVLPLHGARGHATS